MKKLLQKIQQKKKYIFLGLGILICITGIIFMTKSILYHIKIKPLIKEEESYRFPDIKDETKHSTGLINKDIEKKLNEVGIFDYEIERLDEDDLKLLNNCSDIKKIEASKSFHVKNFIRKIEDYEEGYAELEEISGKHVVSKGVELHSNATIIFQTDSNKEKNILNTINISTWYKMPKKLGSDLLYFNFDLNEVNVLSNKAYGVYNVDTYKDLSATTLKRKEKNVYVKTPYLTTRILETDNSKSLIFMTDKLFKYLDLEKTSYWKALYKDLRRKEIEFVKSNNVSFIVSLEHKVYKDRESIPFLIDYCHQIKDVNKTFKMPSTIEELDELQWSGIITRYDQDYNLYDLVINEDNEDEYDDATEEDEYDDATEEDEYDDATEEDDESYSEEYSLLQYIDD